MWRILHILTEPICGPALQYSNVIIIPLKCRHSPQSIRRFTNIFTVPGDAEQTAGVSETDVFIRHRYNIRYVSNRGVVGRGTL